MTNEEVANIMRVLREEYRSDGESSPERVKLWRITLERAGCIDYREAQDGVVRLLAKWKSSYMPPVGALVAEIKEARPKSDTVIELWNIAERMINKGTVLTTEEFREAPKSVQRYFGSAARIRELALLPPSETANERARFLRAMPEIIQNEETRAALPDKMRERIDALAAQKSADRLLEEGTENNGTTEIQMPEMPG